MPEMCDGRSDGCVYTLGFGNEGPQFIGSRSIELVYCCREEYPSGNSSFGKELFKKIDAISVG